MRSREQLVGLADRLLAGAREHASPDHALITIPGPTGGRGKQVDGLEGFARTFMLAAFRIAGSEDGDEEAAALADWYAAGIEAGVDPNSPNRWIRPKEASQARVEVASIALGLDMTRRQIWDRLSERSQQQLVEYMAEVVGDDDYPPNNWLWFRIVTETFLRSVGGPFSLEDFKTDLALYESFERPGGWYTDGAGRKFDHYAGWAMLLYPVLWERMQGAKELIAELDPSLPARTRDSLGLFLADAVRLLGGQGGPLIYGRSLIYRFAAAAPFWAGIFADVQDPDPALLRSAATAVVAHFEDHGVPNEDDLLTLGWFQDWPKMAQSYSGPSSPYWASKGLLGIALPADHPVWSLPEEELPAAKSDQLFQIEAPGWVVSTTRADGIVRIANHGNDNAALGSAGADSPLYARFGYSSATAPWLRDVDWESPSDQSVSLLDKDGNGSHRSGFTFLGFQGPGVASSLNLLRWMDLDEEQDLFGAGLVGTSAAAGTAVVHSILHGPWELRLVRFLTVAPQAKTLRLSGWAVSGEHVRKELLPNSALVTGDGVTSILSVADGDGSGGAIRQTGVMTAKNATFLGSDSGFPYAEVQPRVGDTYGILIGLMRNDLENSALDWSLATTNTAGGGLEVAVTWPDGSEQRVSLDSFAERLASAMEKALDTVRSTMAKFKGIYPDDHTRKLRYLPRAGDTGEYHGHNVGWTTGFWVGTCATASQLMPSGPYLDDLDAHIESFTRRLDDRLELEHHDMGFLYTLAGTLPYLMTGRDDARQMALRAADVLMGRYLEPAGIIQAWGDLSDPSQQGRAIIDSLMNLPLLHWATAETGDRTYADAALRHAERLVENIIREDGSTYHTFTFDTETGEALEGTTAQGASDDSTWARGQAWGIYGFSLAYQASQQPAMLEAAITCADRYLELLPADMVPYWDMVFTAADEEPRDSSSAAIAASGLLELADILQGTNQQADADRYRQAAVAMVDALATSYATDPETSDALLGQGVYSKPHNRGVEEGSVWGDYFYLEALARLVAPDWVNPWVVHER